jgi:hypothetical protein
MIGVLIVSKGRFIEEALQNKVEFTLTTIAPNANKSSVPDYEYKLLEQENYLQLYSNDGKLIDEYKKPVLLGLLLAKLGKLFINCQPIEIDCSGYIFLPQRRRIISADNLHSISLTEKETETLRLLFECPVGISKEDLLEKVWGYSSQVMTSTAETHIYRLRQKLKNANIPWQILSVDNIYKLEV